MISGSANTLFQQKAIHISLLQIKKIKASLTKSLNGIACMDNRIPFPAFSINCLEKANYLTFVLVASIFSDVLYLKERFSLYE